MTTTRFERHALEAQAAGECRGLLESRHVGRPGYSNDFGPRIVPMNYSGSATL